MGIKIVSALFLKFARNRRDARDRKILDRDSVRLNLEALDVPGYQAVE